MTIVVLALDQAPNHTGWAMGSPCDPRPLFGKFDLAPWGNDEPARVGMIFLWLQDMIEKFHVTHLFYELDVPRAGLGKAVMSSPKRGQPRPIVVNSKDPAITRNQNAVIAMCWLAAWLQRIPVAPIDVGDMRAQFIGCRSVVGLKGDAQTAELKKMALKACAMRGWLVEDHNVAEALGHLDYALAALDRRHHGTSSMLSARAGLAIWNGERA